ncbi:hypothetical protein [Sphingobacterium mizutaii]|uniref:hypothetical protein n=1 Tax=Sphingobacterium mizutaii TaxID=1010 RepID=UPI0028A197C2|nr:hypothetical protein [Sphingobacterium mizutaii]
MFDEKIQYHRGVLPSPLAPNSVKLSKEFGVNTARAIYNSFVEGDQSYYQKRNATFKSNRVFAAGKQPMDLYLKLMNIEEKSSFVKLSYHPRPIAPKFRDILVNSIMQKLERVKCKGLSLEISERKEQKKNDAAFRMKEKDYVSKLNQEAGIPFEAEDDFTPSSQEELDLWSQLNDEEFEELLMSEGINFIFLNNNWNDILKKQIAESFVDTGMAFVKNSFDRGKRIANKVIRPEQMIYSSTSSLTFDKGAYIGHLEQMQVTDIRILFPDISEAKLHAMCKRHMNDFGNPGYLGDWNNTYDYAHLRPYDGFVLEVMFYEYKATKYITAVESYDRNNKKIIEYVKDTWGANSEVAADKKVVKTAIPAIYAGAWIVGSDDVLKWGEQDDQLRDNENVEDLSFSYDGYMLNNDGSMIPTCPIMGMKSSIIQMDLAVLKIQHHMATVAPDGDFIDVDAASDIDLGAGVGKVGPLVLLKIKQQTGNRYYSSRGMKGDRRNPPIEQALNQMGDKISQFIMVYNFELGCLKDYIGFNDATDGSGINPRMGAQVMNNQIQASNTATAHIYGGYIYLFGRVARGNGIRLWDTLKEADPNAMYMRILGRKNVDFIRKRKDLTASNYDVNVSIDMSDSDRQFLEQNISVSLQAGLIKLEDAVFVRKLTNLDLAARYLTFIQKKREKEAHEREIEMQNNAQENQGRIVAQQQQQQMEMKAAQEEASMKQFQEKSALEQFTQVQKGIFDALLKSMDPNSKAIPAYIQTLIDKQVQDDLAREEQEALAAEQEAAMQAEQEEMEGQAVPV